MSLAETWAFERRYRSFYLSAEKKRAIKFYQRLGYRPTITDELIDTESIDDGKYLSVAYEFCKTIEKYSNMLLVFNVNSQ